MQPFRSYTFTEGGRPEPLRAGGVWAGFFEVLGFPPPAGRWFLPEEDQPGRATSSSSVNDLKENGFIEGETASIYFPDAQLPT